MSDRFEPDPQAPGGRDGAVPGVTPWRPAVRTSSLPWSRTRDDAPDLRAGVPYLADHVTKVGIFRRLDPGDPGRLWNRWRWAGLVFWAALVGGAVAKAWRDEGGLPDRPDTG